MSEKLPLCFAAETYPYAIDKVTALAYSILKRNSGLRRETISYLSFSIFPQRSIARPWMVHRRTGFACVRSLRALSRRY